MSARFPAASPHVETDVRQRSGIALPKRRETLAHPRENGVMDTKTAMKGSLVFSFKLKWAGYRAFKLQHGSMDSQTQAFSTDSGDRHRFSNMDSNGIVYYTKIVAV